MARVMAAFFLGILALGLAQSNAFVGVWEARYNDPNFGPTYVQMVFQPNGSYSQETRTQAGATCTSPSATPTARPTTTASPTATPWCCSSRAARPGSA